MPTASRRACEYPGCTSGPPGEGGVNGPYLSHEDCSTKAEVTEDIKNHVEMAHRLPMQVQQNAANLIGQETARIKAQTEQLKVQNASNDDLDGVDDSTDTTQSNRSRFTNKRDSIPRPTIDENCTESDWNFFTAPWKRYTMGSNMTDEQEIQQMWAAASQTLQRKLHSGGGNRATTPLQILNSMKFLAVKRRNNVVNIVKFQRMGQSTEESITSYSTRLNGHADICDLFVTCPQCSHDVSYKDDFILYQFLRGLNDTGIQERILETAAQSPANKLTLIQGLKIAEAYEMGKSSQTLVNSGGQLSKISQHQQNKQTSRQSGRAKSQESNSAKCGNCGRTDHTSKINDRRENCPAFSVNCNKCKTNGHLPLSAEGTLVKHVTSPSLRITTKLRMKKHLK